MTTPVKLERCPVTDEIKAQAREILSRHLEYMDGLNRGQYNMKVHNALAAVEEALAMHQASRIAEGIVSEEAIEQIVADNIEAWGWGPLEDIEGLSEHKLAVDACRAGYVAALHTLSVGGIEK
jgi:hypothetical protein